jgi:hypothetical protein
MRLLCRAHNQYEAECVFGAGFMSEKREAAQRARAAKAAARMQAAETPARMQAAETPARAAATSARATASSASAAAAVPSSGPSSQPALEPSDDLQSALRTLGYRKDEVRRAAAHCAAFPGASLEAQVRLALRHLMLPHRRVTASAPVAT